LRADHSKAEREDTDAWLSHYNFKTNFIWSSSQDTDIPMPTITKDDSCHLWLNIADFHWTNPFDLFPSFMGYIDLYNNDNQLCYEFSTMIGTQFGA
jgi:hypothetical protein